METIDVVKSGTVALMDKLGFSVSELGGQERALSLFRLKDGLTPTVE